MIRPPVGGRALDVGCGRAEGLLKLARAHDIHVTGVDRSSAALEEAEAAFVEHASETTRRWVQSDVKAFAQEAETYDVISWLGGPYVGENFPSTVEALSSWLSPGGFLLLGHGFWHHEPPPEYLEATGFPRAELAGHMDNIQVGRDADLVLLYTCVSTRDEWDVFEGLILYNYETYAMTHPEEDLAELLKKKRDWNDAQQRWGRDSMGFALYLFQKPQ